MRKRKPLNAKGVLGKIVKVLLGILVLLIVLMVIGMNAPDPAPAPAAEPTTAPTEEPVQAVSFTDWLNETTRMFTKVTNDYQITSARTQGDFAFVEADLRGSEEKLRVFADDIANMVGVERTEISTLKQTWKKANGSVYFGYRRNGTDMDLFETYETK